MLDFWTRTIAGAWRRWEKEVSLSRWVTCSGSLAANRKPLERRHTWARADLSWHVSPSPLPPGSHHLLCEKDVEVSANHLYVLASQGGPQGRWQANSVSRTERRTDQSPRGHELKPSGRLCADPGLGGAGGRAEARVHSRGLLGVGTWLGLAVMCQLWWG